MPVSSNLKLLAMSLLSKIRGGSSVLSDFYEDAFNNEKWFKDSLIPAINVAETGENYELEIAAPGIKKDDFNISMENGVLTITGRSESEEEEKKKNYTRREFNSRSFSRSFTLPEDVSSESIEAFHNDGVLKLVIPRAPRAASDQKQIAIN